MSNGKTFFLFPICFDKSKDTCSQKRPKKRPVAIVKRFHNKAFDSIEYAHYRAPQRASFWAYHLRMRTNRYEKRVYRAFSSDAN